MSEMSDYTEDQLVLHFFRTGNATAVSVMAVALLTTAADDDDAATFQSGGPETGVEVTNAGAYARVDRPPLDANWTATAAGDGQTDNAAAITFTQATGNWGTIQAIALCSSATWNTGNVYFHTTVDTAKAVNTDDTAEFAAGAITVTFA
jgi:hypothetical protein